MRSLWIIGMALVISILVGCQASGVSLSQSDDNNTAGSSASLTLNVTQPVDESIVRSSPLTVTGNIKPDADVMINGLSVAVENGHFSALVEVEPGPNTIDISAIDSSGNQASRHLTIVYVP